MPSLPLMIMFHICCPECIISANNIVEMRHKENVHVDETRSQDEERFEETVTCYLECPECGNQEDCNIPAHLTPILV